MEGAATYWDVVIGDAELPRVGWSYANPTSGFAALRDHVAFYAAPFDRCSVDGETVVPQPGDFYGGWITSALAGPFKGSPRQSRVVSVDARQKYASGSAHVIASCRDEADTR